MNPIPHPQANTAPTRPHARMVMHPPAFHSQRAIVPRKTMRPIPTPAAPSQPSYETRAFPIELAYVS